jgi:hypothetical protein
LPHVSESVAALLVRASRYESLEVPIGALQVDVTIPLRRSAILGAARTELGVNR